MSMIAIAVILMRSASGSVSRPGDGRPHDGDLRTDRSGAAAGS